MSRSLSGEPVYTCVKVLWNDDRQHIAEPLPKGGFSVVYDPSELFRTGASFDRHQVAITLWLGDWPDGIVFKDLRDGAFYRAVPHVTRTINSDVFNRQKLRCIFDTCELVPRDNSGGFRRIQL